MCLDCVSLLVPDCVSPPLWAENRLWFVIHLPAVVYECMSVWCLKSYRQYTQSIALFKTVHVSEKPSGDLWEINCLSHYLTVQRSNRFKGFTMQTTAVAVLSLWPCRWDFVSETIAQTYTCKIDHTYSDSNLPLLYTIYLKNFEFTQQLCLLSTGVNLRL